MNENRDDSDTINPPSPAGSRTGFVFSVPSEQRCRVSSICQSVDSRVFAATVAAANGGFGEDSKEEEAAATAEESNEEVSSQLNDTRMDMEDERLDLNSVLSGTMEEDDATVRHEDAAAGGNVSVKNLSRLFEENDARTAATAAAKPTRPPLAPGRSNLKTEEGTAKSTTEEDKSLSVFLRIRPPVSATGKAGEEGSISTIEVLENESTSPNTVIRTYPPLTSNAAKVVRTGNKLVKMNTSKSLNEEGGRNSDECEVLGVKEYAYSGVFGQNSTQKEIYERIGAPLVEGLFPEDKNGELGESALLFTLGVTNAGKT